MKIIRYDSTGKIHSVQTMDDLSMTDGIRELLGEEGVLYMPSVYTMEVNDVRHYVDDGVVIERPTQQLSVEGLVLKGVQAGASVVIEGSAYEVAESGDIELEFAHSGSYEVKVVHWPYHDWSAQIEN